MDKKAAQMFGTLNGQVLDVLHVTSDGELHFTPDDAEKRAAKLNDPTITLYYRDAAVRKFIVGKPLLEKTMFTTDYLRLQKFCNKKPSYEEYLSRAEKVGKEPVDRVLYDFLFRRSFASKQPVQCGERHEIYTYKSGIQKAVFIRRIRYTLVWQVSDETVLTTLFNTELLREPYSAIFEPVLKAL